MVLEWVLAGLGVLGDSPQHHEDIAIIKHGFLSSPFPVFSVLPMHELGQRAPSSLPSGVLLAVLLNSSRFMSSAPLELSGVRAWMALLATRRMFCRQRVTFAILKLSSRCSL